jgi:tetratricopeptide (TPR) repeat protein
MSTSSNQAAGDLQSDLLHAASLLHKDPAQARAKAGEILQRYPESAPALHVLGVARRLQGDTADALAVLRPLAQRHPDDANILHDYALCLAADGQGEDALGTLRKVLAIDPGHSAAWRSLGDQLSVAGDAAGAEQAYDKHLALVSKHPELVEAAKFLNRGNLAKAEQISRAVLMKDATDVVAMRILASVGVKVGQLKDAAHLLERCLELAPDFHIARHNYASLLVRRNELENAQEQVEVLLRAEPKNPNSLILKATILVRMGEHAAALAIYENILKHYPLQSDAYMNYGHTLKTVGRLDESIAAYRKSIELRPATGEAYWSLANLKTFRFSDDDIRDMRSQVVETDGDPEDQAHLAFALGKALEDRKQYDESFSFYQRGNAIRGKHHRYNAKINVYNSARQVKALDAEFFAAREGWGCKAADPIFIVGLPRAGSTLLEQILASHSQVEGTAELPDIIAMSRKLGQKSRENPASLYPEVLAKLSAGQVRELGESYIQTTQVQRHGLPYFIDKMPNNFQHIGLIHLILPNAKIIDARRHPMAGCFSCFKQLFARGQTFTYNLTDLGKYYRDYLILMDHWDRVLPGRVHRVQYEDMVADTEQQIRALLDYCGFEFEEQCLRFYETKRAIRTPSAEQVRQPVYKEGLEQWRHFEAHLGPLRDALGTVLQRYPID